LRDDVKKLFDELLTLLDEKTHYLNNLFENGICISRLINQKTDNEGEILKVFNKNNDLIDKIDINDFNISEIKDELTRRYLFDFEKILSDICLNPESEIMGFRERVMKHKSLISEILFINERNYNDMNDTGNDLKQQISEIRRIERIRFIYPEDKKL